MKLKTSFETVEMADGFIAVPSDEAADDSRMLLRLNETAADILELLKNETTEEKVVAAMQEKYDGDKTEIEKCVREYLKQLENAGVLE